MIGVPAPDRRLAHAAPLRPGPRGRGFASNFRPVFMGKIHPVKNSRPRLQEFTDHHYVAKINA
jgi:hypothetical protein